MRKKRWLCILLSLVFVFNIAFAIEGKAQAKGTEKKVETVNTENLKLNAGNTHVVKSMLYSTTKEPAYTKKQLRPLTYELIPLEVKHMGNMYFDYYVEGLGNSYTNEYVSIALIDEENAIAFENDPSAGYYYLNNMYYTCYYDGSRSNCGPTNMRKSDNYYLLIINWNQELDVEVGIKTMLYTTGERTLEQGTSKWTTVSSIDKNKETKATWFKVKPNMTGVMSVSLKQYGYNGSAGYVTLYNGNRKAISEKVYYSTSNGRKVNFGVKKGVTYYLKVENCYGVYSENYKIGVKYGMTARTDRALGKKANAKTLKRKADATNTLFVASNSKSTDWYKFKVSSKKVTVFRVNAKDMSSGSLKITAYCGSKKIGTATLYARNYNDYTITNGTTYGKADAGTYYVKIEKDYKASGKYSIRYLK